MECDTHHDCEDMSDEHFKCDYAKKFGDIFHCDSNYHEIYPNEFECDITVDCSDGSDEHEGCNYSKYYCQQNSIKEISENLKESQMNVLLYLLNEYI